MSGRLDAVVTLVEQQVCRLGNLEPGISSMMQLLPCAPAGLPS
jgi:hypothetical protein